MIRFIADNKEIPVKVTEYSDGALAVNIALPESSSFQTGHLTIEPSVKAYKVGLLIDLFIDNLSCNAILYKALHLHLPYFPFARAERKFSDGDGVPIDHFIEKLHYFHMCEAISSVSCVDLHFKNKWEFITEQPQHTIHTLTHALKWNSYDAVIAPDNGAKPKIDKLRNNCALCPELILTATKVRNKESGRIESVAFDQDIPVNVKKVIIVDDILDYGGTFIPLAQDLKQRGIEVHLHVTHLIAAGGLERFQGFIDKIFCYHTVAGYVTMDDVLKFNNSSLTVKRED